MSRKVARSRDALRSSTLRLPPEALGEGSEGERMRSLVETPFDDPEPIGTDERASVVAVRSTVRGTGLPLVPRIVVVALVVGVVTFVAGFALGQQGTSGTASGVGARSAAPSATRQPSATAPAAPGVGRSLVAESLDPVKLVRGIKGGGSCAARQAADSWANDVPTPTLTRIWLFYCQIPPDLRASFIQEVLAGLIQEVLADLPVMGHASGSSVSGGPTVWISPYKVDSLEGSITLAANDAGPGYEIVITLQERSEP